MRRLGALFALPLFAMPLAAGAAPAPIALKLDYVTYAHGFTVLDLAATLDLSATGYRLTIDYHTVGMVGFFSPGHAAAEASGSFHAGKAVPLHFESEGKWGGKAFDVQISYGDGVPDVRRLVPDETHKRESVPAALTHHTIDTVSAMASLLARMAGGGSCGMALKVFDGRQLMTVDSKPSGSQKLQATTRSFFHGTAERCALAGRALAGFLRSEDEAERNRVDQGEVWFARPVAGLPMLPVKIAFPAQGFGTATMYLTDVQAAPAPPDGLARVAKSYSQVR